MYRPPSSNEDMHLISNELYTICDKYKIYNICISGDFDLPNIKWLISCSINNNKTTTNFVPCVIDNGLSSVVDFKTIESNTLDLIIRCNFSCLIDAKVIEHLINSDQESIEYKFDLS